MDFETLYQSQHHHILYINEWHNSVALKRSEREKLSLEIATLKSELQSAEKEEENIRNNLKKEEGYLFELEDSRIAKQATYEEYGTKINLFKDEITKLSEESRTVESGLKTVEEELSGIEKSKSELNDKLGINELQLKDKETQLESIKNQMRDLDVKLNGLGYKRLK